jgi:hypothetical protein
LENGETITLNSADDINGVKKTVIGLPPVYVCNLTNVSYPVTKNQIDKFFNSKVKSIRFYRTESNGKEDFIDNEIKKKYSVQKANSIEVVSDLKTPVLKNSRERKSRSMSSSEISSENITKSTKGNKIFTSKKLESNSSQDSNIMNHTNKVNETKNVIILDELELDSPKGKHSALKRNSNKKNK